MKIYFLLLAVLLLAVARAEGGGQARSKSYREWKAGRQREGKWLPKAEYERSKRRAEWRWYHYVLAVPLAIGGLVLMAGLRRSNGR